MKCIIDVVYNHTSPDSVLSVEHPEWFYRDENGKPKAKVEEWWDIVDLDYSNRGLWDYLIETLCYWAQYVDGFRCDVASFISARFLEEGQSSGRRECAPAHSGLRRVLIQVLYKG